MRVHLADGSPNRGQYTLLSSEKYLSSLVSYAYRTAALPCFERYWDELVRIHLAANPTGNSGLQGHVLALESDTNDLLSYAYRKEEPSYQQLWDMRIHLTDTTAQLQGDLRPRVIIDSGAFTAWSTGKRIDPRDYAEWALDFDKRWRHKMASLEFMNLDVIGDQDASWRNQAILERLGMAPLPIITFGVDLKHLDRALEEYDYIALGGLVPYSRDKVKLKKWLDACFSRVMSYRKKNRGYASYPFTGYYYRLGA